MLKWFRQPRALPQIPPEPVANPIALGPDDDLVVSIPRGRMERGFDAVAYIGQLQASFPANRIHLLIGDGLISAARDCPNCHIGETWQARADQARASGVAPGRPVVLLTHSSGGELFAVSVPPRGQVR